MKIVWGMSFILIGTLRLQGQTLQVPEDCLVTKTVPCLAQVKSFTDKPFDLGSYEVTAVADTIMKWTSFEGDIAVELVKGKIQLHKLKKPKAEASAHDVKKEHGGEHKEVAHDEHGPKHDDKQEKPKTESHAAEVVKDETLRINGVLIDSSYVMVHKNSDNLKVLTIKNFTVSEYDLTDLKQPPILIKSQFADKSEIVFLSAPFFKTKNKFLGFLKVIEKPFEKILEKQAETQTEVLKRALASVEEENKEAAAEKAAKDEKLKKVRELFFYRTFYR